MNNKKFLLSIFIISALIVTSVIPIVAATERGLERPREHLDVSEGLSISDSWSTHSIDTDGAEMENLTEIQHEINCTSAETLEETLDDTTSYSDSIDSTSGASHPVDTSTSKVEVEASVNTTKDHANATYDTDTDWNDYASKTNFSVGSGSLKLSASSASLNLIRNKSDADCFALSPDGEQMALQRNTDDTKVDIITIDGWTTEDTLTLSMRVRSMAWSPDDSYLALAQGRTDDNVDHYVVYNVGSWSQDFSVSYYQDTVSSGTAGDLAFSENGDYMTCHAFGQDGSGNFIDWIDIYNTGSWSVDEEFKDDNDFPSAPDIEVFRDGYMYTLPDDRSGVDVYNTGSWSLEEDLNTDNIPADVVVTPDGDYLFTHRTSTGGYTEYYDTSDWSLVDTLTVASDSNQMDVSNDTVLLRGANPDYIKVYDFDGNLLAEKEVRVYSPRFSPTDDSLIYVEGNYDNLETYEIVPGTSPTDGEWISTIYNPDYSEAIRYLNHSIAETLDSGVETSYYIKEGSGSWEDLETYENTEYMPTNYQFKITMDMNGTTTYPQTIDKLDVEWKDSLTMKIEESSGPEYGIIYYDEADYPKTKTFTDLSDSGGSLDISVLDDDITVQVDSTFYEYTMNWLPTTVSFTVELRNSTGGVIDTFTTELNGSQSDLTAFSGDIYNASVIAYKVDTDQRATIDTATKLSWIILKEGAVSTMWDVVSDVTFWAIIVSILVAGITGWKLSGQTAFVVLLLSFGIFTLAGYIPIYVTGITLFAFIAFRVYYQRYTGD